MVVENFHKFQCFYSRSSLLSAYGPSYITDKKHKEHLYIKRCLRDRIIEDRGFLYREVKVGYASDVTMFG